MPLPEASVPGKRGILRGLLLLGALLFLRLGRYPPAYPEQAH